MKAISTTIMIPKIDIIVITRTKSIAITIATRALVLTIQRIIMMVNDRVSPCVLHYQNGFSRRVLLWVRFAAKMNTGWGLEGCRGRVSHFSFTIELLLGVS